MQDACALRARQQWRRTAGVAVAGGPKVAELKNSKGVELSVKGQQVGLEFSVDLSGMEIKLKKK